MSMLKTLGGERLGSGKRQKVELHGYERSTHDMGYLWRSTMSAGTLVPFMTEVALPGDTFDINLECDVKTHPTIGPLFGSYKVQLDVFQAPIRLYQGQLHNNKLGIGMNMANVKLPTIQLTAVKEPGTIPDDYDLDNSQINPSCILSYLGIRGVGYVNNGDETYVRFFNAVPLLAYWDIYKQYYANKNEEGTVTGESEPTAIRGAVIHSTLNVSPDENVSVINIDDGPSTGTIAEYPEENPMILGTTTVIELVGVAAPQDDRTILLKMTNGQSYFIDDLFFGIDTLGNDTTFTDYKFTVYGALTVLNWRYVSARDFPNMTPGRTFFKLDNIDLMREQILAWATQGSLAFDINNSNNAYHPYDWVCNPQGNEHCMRYTQEGLGLKTYQSDLFNNWLNTEWLDGTGGINEITAVSTADGDQFKIDALILAKKVYDMLNRIAVSGGSYDDWLDAVYTHERIQRAESPIYHGGLIRELVFQEVVSNSESAEGTQPLGTLAGKGVMGQKRKGGQVTIKVDEPSYIMGIISLTPRIDYSQGNKWDVHLLTMDDLHKPALDQIGFQELITEQMAWWSTQNDGSAGPVGVWQTRSAGKQPAWINYMTNVNQCRGNFAIEQNEMFMTLNRRYEKLDGADSFIDDLTTYIDPVKYNFIFAQTSLDAQNFWAQIAVDITARRKMSAKVMPNL